MMFINWSDSKILLLRRLQSSTQTYTLYSDDTFNFFLQSIEGRGFIERKFDSRGVEGTIIWRSMIIDGVSKSRYRENDFFDRSK